jgi:1-acyl-sn-glycerol-3-phosphate acyltransferase
MNKYTYDFIIRILRTFGKKPRIAGLEHYKRGVPSIFVANHLGSFGPVVMKVFFPIDLVPWVTYEIMDKNLCPDYLRDDFVEKELKLKPPLSIIASKMLSKICISLMVYIGAIPVYKKGKKILAALHESVHILEKGHDLIIFPEIPDLGANDQINEFYTGFINIAKYFFKRNNANIAFYPVCIHKENSFISITKPIIYNPKSAFPNEKKRIINLLKDSIMKMFREIDPSR